MATDELERILKQDFAYIPELIRLHASANPDKPALILDGNIVSYRTLDEKMDFVAAALQRDRIKPTDVISICAATSVAYIALFLGSLRAGYWICYPVARLGRYCNGNSAILLS